MIAGSPGGLVAAGAELRRAGSDLEDVIEGIAAGVTALAEVWTGTTADDARAAITEVGTLVGVMAAVCALAEQALLDYADVLRSAQEQYEAGEDVATAGAVAATPTQVAAGQAQMTAAVGRAERANQAAADRIMELVAQLEPLPAPWTPGYYSPGQSAQDMAAGAGEVAWQAGPGALEWVYSFGLAPGHTEAAQVLRGVHDDLEEAFGADTSSDEYALGQGATQLATLFTWRSLISGGRRLDELADPPRSVADEVDRAWATRTHERPPGDTWGNPATLDDHFDRHGPEVGARDEAHYVQLAEDFRQRGLEGELLVKVDREQETVRMYDPSTGRFAAYNFDGTAKTIQTRDAAYWDRQPGGSPW